MEAVLKRILPMWAGCSSPRNHDDLSLVLMEPPFACANGIFMGPKTGAESLFQVPQKGDLPPPMIERFAAGVEDEGSPAGAKRQE
jgi:hypothetical protein